MWSVGLTKIEMFVDYFICEEKGKKKSNCKNRNNPQFNVNFAYMKDVSVLV